MAEQPSFKAVNSINQGSAPVPHTRSSTITLEFKSNLVSCDVMLCHSISSSLLKGLCHLHCHGLKVHDQWTLNFWLWWQHAPWKHCKLLNQQHHVTTQKTIILNYTTVKTPKLTLAFHYKKMLQDCTPPVTQKAKRRRCRVNGWMIYSKTVRFGLGWGGGHQRQITLPWAKSILQKWLQEFKLASWRLHKCDSGNKN